MFELSDNDLLLISGVNTILQVIFKRNVGSAIKRYKRFQDRKKHSKNSSEVIAVYGLK
jgi:hypothetical protein